MNLDSAVVASALHSFSLTRRFAEASPGARGDKEPLSPQERGRGEGLRCMSWGQHRYQPSAWMKQALLILLLVLLATPALAKGLKELPPKPAPPLALTSLAGEKVDLGQLRGKVVLVNFWATWCPPCRQEMPSMARLSDKLAGKPFTLLGVNVGETPDQVNAFLKLVPVDFPIVLDEKGQNLNAWQVFAFPTSYLVDKQGRIRYGLFGSIEWDEPEAVRVIEGLLAEP